jgi:hypothetical protein
MLFFKSNTYCSTTQYLNLISKYARRSSILSGYHHFTQLIDDHQYDKVKLPLENSSQDEILSELLQTK